MEGEDITGFAVVSPLTWFDDVFAASEMRLGWEPPLRAPGIMAFYRGVTATMDDGSKIALKTLYGELVNLTRPPPTGRPPSTFDGLLTALGTEFPRALNRRPIICIVDCVNNYPDDRDKRRMIRILQLLINVAESRHYKYHLRLLIASTHRLGLRSEQPSVTKFFTLPAAIVDAAQIRARQK